MIQLYNSWNKITSLCSNESLLFFHPRLAIQAIKQLHPDIVTSVQSKTLFSKEEERLLGQILSVRGGLSFTLGKWSPIHFHDMSLHAVPMDKKRHEKILASNTTSHATSICPRCLIVYWLYITYDVPDNVNDSVVVHVYQFNWLF